MSMKKERLYKNGKWLYDKYINKKLSTKQIGRLCKIDAFTIGYWLKKYNILIRSSSEGHHLRCGNHCKLSKKAIKWINGELLGDGSLDSQSIYSANFNYTSKYYEYCQYVSNILQSFGIKQTGKIRKYYKEIDSYNSYTYSYRSCAYVELLPIRKQWYPEGKKIVPKDIKLTSSTTKQWYIGDGYLGHQKNSRPYIQLCTNGFSILDVEWLVIQLIKLGFRAKRQRTNSIYIFRHSTKDFLDYIGKCPVKCYQYKFDYRKVGI